MVTEEGFPSRGSLISPGKVFLKRACAHRPRAASRPSNWTAFICLRAIPVRLLSQGDGESGAGRVQLVRGRGDGVAEAEGEPARKAVRVEAE